VLTPRSAAKKRLPEIVARLRQIHPDAECALHHQNAWQLVVATILSAQCTDERVNLVTPVLFARFPTPRDLAEADPGEVEDIIRSTGFYRNKARNIQGAARAVVSEFGGEVPTDMQELLTLPGVARKTANVVRGVAFGVADGIVVDTHVGRLARRLGLTKADDPVKVERDLMAITPREDWIDLSHLLIFHGRRVCDAKRPRCADCGLADLCPSAGRAVRPPRRPPAKAKISGDPAS
jgi:endonuclease-3